MYAEKNLFYVRMHDIVRKYILILNRNGEIDCNQHHDGKTKKQQFTMTDTRTQGDNF